MAESEALRRLREEKLAIIQELSEEKEAHSLTLLQLDEERKNVEIQTQTLESYQGQLLKFGKDYERSQASLEETQRSLLLTQKKLAEERKSFETEKKSLQLLAQAGQQKEEGRGHQNHINEQPLLVTNETDRTPLLLLAEERRNLDAARGQIHQVQKRLDASLEDQLRERNLFDEERRSWERFKEQLQEEKRTLALRVEDLLAKLEEEQLNVELGNATLDSFRKQMAPSDDNYDSEGHEKEAGDEGIDFLRAQALEMERDGLLAEREQLRKRLQDVEAGRESDAQQQYELAQSLQAQIEALRNAATANERKEVAGGEKQATAFIGKDNEVDEVQLKGQLEAQRKHFLHVVEEKDEEIKSRKKEIMRLETKVKATTKQLDVFRQSAAEDAKMHHQLVMELKSELSIARQHEHTNSTSSESSASEIRAEAATSAPAESVPMPSQHGEAQGLRSQLAEKDQQLSSVNERVGMLEEQLKQSRSAADLEVEKMKADLERLKEEKEQALESVTQQQSDVESLRQTIQRLTLQISEQSDEIASVGQEHNQAQSDLQRKHEVSEQHINELEHQLAEQMALVDRHREELESHRKEIEDKESDIEDLKNRLQCSEEAQAALQHTVPELEQRQALLVERHQKEAESQRKEIEDKESDIEDLNHRLQQSEKERATLQHTVPELEQRLAEQAVLMERHQKESESHRKEIEDKESDIEDLNHRLQLSEEERVALEQRVPAVGVVEDSSGNQTEDHEQHKEAEDVRLREWEQREEELREKLGALTDQLARVAAEHQQSLQLLKEQEAEIAVKTGEVVRLSHVAEQLKQVTAEKEEAKDAARLAQHSCATLTEQLMQAGGLLANKTSSVAELQHKASEDAKTVGELRSMLEILRQQSTDGEASTQETVRRLEDAQRRHEQAIAEKDTLVAEANRLGEDLLAKCQELEQSIKQKEEELQQKDEEVEELTALREQDQVQEEIREAERVQNELLRQKLSALEGECATGKRELEELRKKEAEGEAKRKAANASSSSPSRILQKKTADLRKQLTEEESLRKELQEQLEATKAKLQKEAKEKNALRKARDELQRELASKKTALSETGAQATEATKRSSALSAECEQAKISAQKLERKVLALNERLKKSKEKRKYYKAEREKLTSIAQELRIISEEWPHRLQRQAEEHSAQMDRERLKHSDLLRSYELLQQQQRDKSVVREDKESALREHKKREQEVEELKQINLELLEVLEKQKKRPAVDQSELLLLREKEERARNELLTEKGSHSYTLQQLEHHKAMFSRKQQKLARIRGDLTRLKHDAEAKEKHTAVHQKEFDEKERLLREESESYARQVEQQKKALQVAQEALNEEKVLHAGQKEMVEKLSRHIRELKTSNTKHASPSTSEAANEALQLERSAHAETRSQLAAARADAEAASVAVLRAQVVALKRVQQAQQAVQLFLDDKRFGEHIAHLRSVATAGEEKDTSADPAEVLHLRSQVERLTAQLKTQERPAQHRETTGGEVSVGDLLALSPISMTPLDGNQQDVVVLRGAAATDYHQSVLAFLQSSPADQSTLEQLKAKRQAYLATLEQEQSRAKLKRIHDNTLLLKKIILSFHTEFSGLGRLR